MTEPKKDTEVKNGDSGHIDEDSDAVFDDTDTEDPLPAHDATLAERILWVRDRVGYLKKDAKVSTGGEGFYAAVSHDAVTAHLRAKFVQAGIFHWVSCVESTDHETGLVTDKGRKVLQNRATFEVTFESVFDKTDCRVLRVVAHADDRGDKAPGKTLSYATKYALLKISMLETGEEDEARITDQSATRIGVITDDEQMLNDLWALADELFGDDAARTLKSMAGRRFFVESYGEIPQDRYEDAIRALQTSKKQLDESKSRQKESTSD